MQLHTRTRTSSRWIKALLSKIKIIIKKKLRYIVNYVHMYYRISEKYQPPLPYTHARNRDHKQENAEFRTPLKACINTINCLLRNPDNGRGRALKTLTQWLKRAGCRRVSGSCSREFAAFWRESAFCQLALECPVTSG